MSFIRVTPTRLLILAIAAVAVALALLTPLSKQRTAEGAGAVLQLASADCSGASATINFTWIPVLGSTTQWLDVSNQDQNFAPGTFVGIEVSGTASSYSWPGFEKNKAQIWRVNSFVNGGWVSSNTSGFVACSGGPWLVQGSIACDGNAGNVHFTWAAMTPAAQLQYLDLSADPNFSPGSFVSAGPLNGNIYQYDWNGIPGGATYYVRVNAFKDGNWLASQVGVFSAPCGAAAVGGTPGTGWDPSYNPDMYGSYDSISIPALGIGGNINVRDIGPDGLMGDPAGAYDVVRYNFGQYWWPGLGGYPGNGGTTMLAGHVDYRPNIQAVFWELRGAQPGMLIYYTRGDGQTITYQITRATYTAPDADYASFAVSTNPETMVLITCDGAFNPVTRHYDTRFVVFATRVA